MQEEIEIKNTYAFEKEDINTASTSLSEAHTMALGFGGQLSSRKGEVQQFSYRLPAY